MSRIAASALSAKRGRLFHALHRPKNNRTHISEKARQIPSEYPFVLYDQNMYASEIVHVTFPFPPRLPSPRRRPKFAVPRLGSAWPKGSVARERRRHFSSRQAPLLESGVSGFALSSGATSSSPNRKRMTQKRVFSKRIRGRVCPHRSLGLGSCNTRGERGECRWRS